MNEHTTKAKEAVTAAKAAILNGDEQACSKLLRVAEAQAWVSIAESLDRFFEYKGLKPS